MGPCSVGALEECYEGLIVIPKEGHILGDHTRFAISELSKFSPMTASVPFSSS